MTVSPRGKGPAESTKGGSAVLNAAWDFKETGVGVMGTNEAGVGAGPSAGN